MPPLLDVFVVVVVVFFVVDVFTREATTGGALAANISRIRVLASRGTTRIAAAFLAVAVSDAVVEVGTRRRRRRRRGHLLETDFGILVDVTKRREVHVRHEEGRGGVLGVSSASARGCNEVRKHPP